LLHCLYEGLISAGEAQIPDRLLIHREEADGGPVFGGHVGDGGAIGQRHVGHAGPVELHELADHAVLPQHLGDPEDQVGGGRALCELADELETDHLGNQHVDRLTNENGFGFDAAHTPADHSQPVDHGGV